ncbi:MAG: hypothetical protein ACOC2Y_03930 [Spirochaetota bacterium]
MNKLLRVIIAVGLMTLTAGVAFAANGDTLNIGGHVPLALDLTVTASGVADNLPLTIAGVDAPTTQTIATIDVTTNNTAGWELWVFSENADPTDTGLINADLDEITYEIEYLGAGTTGAVDIPDTGALVGEATSDLAQTGETLQITYTQSEGHNAGYYSDQLAIVLRAK